MTISRCSRGSINWERFRGEINGRQKRHVSEHLETSSSSSSRRRPLSRARVREIIRTVTSDIFPKLFFFLVYTQWPRYPASYSPCIWPDKVAFGGFSKTSFIYSCWSKSRIDGVHECSRLTRHETSRGPGWTQSWPCPLNATRGQLYPSAQTWRWSLQ